MPRVLIRLPDCRRALINLLVRTTVRDAIILDARESALVRRRQVRLYVIQIQIKPDVPVKIPVASITRIPLFPAPNLPRRLPVAPESRNPVGRENRGEHC